MARDEGMALAPWGVLAGGKIRSDEEEERRRQTGEKGRNLSFASAGWERDEKEKKVCDALEKVKEEVGAKSLGAGKFSAPISSRTDADPLPSCSCDRLCDAQDSIRLPYHWGQEDRAAGC